MGRRERKKSCKYIYKSLIAFALLICLALPLISAADFNNVKSYDALTQTATIYDEFIFWDHEVATVQLLNKFNLGYEEGEHPVLIMKFNIKDYADGDAISGLKFYNMKKGMKEEFKDYTIKERIVSGQRDVEDYIDDCSKEECVRIKTGTHKEDIYDYRSIDLRDIRDGEITLAVFVNVKEGDKIDVVPMIYGKEITEWFTFTGSKNYANQSFQDNGGTGTNRVLAFCFNSSKSFNITGVQLGVYNGDNCAAGEVNVTLWGLNSSFGLGTYLGVENSSVSVASLSVPNNVYNFTFDNTYNVTANNEWVCVMVNTTANTCHTVGSRLMWSQNRTYQSGTDKFSRFRSCKTTTATDCPLADSDNETFLAEIYGQNITLAPPDPFATANQEAPKNMTNWTITTINFKYNSTDDVGVMNITLFVDGAIINTTTNSTPNQNLTISEYWTMTEGFHNWSIRSVDFTNQVNYSVNWTFNVSTYNPGYVINSLARNTSTYEGLTEHFEANVSFNTNFYTSVAGDLIYNGTAYTGTVSTSGNNTLLSYSLGVPLTFYQTNESRANYWRVALTNATATIYVNSSSANQMVNATNLSLCSATNNVNYINFTFEDESNGDKLNATFDSSWQYYISNPTINRTLIYTSTAETRSYSFCFSPRQRVVYNDRRVQYHATGYPDRVYSESNTLTNSTTNKILYLLGSASGIYTSFQITNPAGQVISGAQVTIQRQISGLWTIVGDSTSDGAGIVTFWVNPNYDLAITVTKTGYSSSTTNIRPTQSIYTIILSPIGSTVYNNTIEGITWVRGPPSGILQSGIYNFYFNVSAINGDIVYCKQELVNESDYVVSSANSTGAYNCSVNANYDFQENELKGKYYVDLGSGYILIEGDGDWKKISINASSSTLSGVIRYLSDPNIWLSAPNDFNSEEYRRYEFTKLVAFFLIFAIIAAFLNISFSFDNLNPGIFLLVFPLIVFIFGIVGAISGYGFFYVSGATPFGRVFDNLVVPIFTLLLGIAYALASLRREG